jgi:hypothetical protein
MAACSRQDQERVQRDAREAGREAKQTADEVAGKLKRDAKEAAREVKQGADEARRKIDEQMDKAKHR